MYNDVLRLFYKIKTTADLEFIPTALINSMNDAKKLALAQEIADALNDRGSIDVHVRFVNKYSETYLRQQLEYVLSRPDSEITSNRAAYYVYLVKRNGKRSWD